MTTGKISIGRAKEIALLLVYYKSQRREVNFKPQNPGHWQEEGKRLGVSPTDAELLFVKVILPAATRALTNGKFGTTLGNLSAIEAEILSNTALAVLQNQSVELHPTKTVCWLKKVSEQTEIPVDELIEFHVRFVIPAIIKGITGWSSCQITGGQFSD